jgi:hypothetical protein
MKFDVERYHKPLSVCIFGGATLALLLATIVLAARGSTGWAVTNGIVFVLVAVPVGWWFMDMFVWEQRRGNAAATDRMKQFLKVEEHRRDRVRQREQGLRG